MSPRITLPQANSLDTVIEVVRYVYYKPSATFEEIADYLGYKERQAHYYVDAGRYLGLIDDQRRPTARCVHIMQDNGIHLVEGVYECIIEDEIMGKVFARCLLRPKSDLDAYAQQVASIYYPDFGEATMERRCHGIVLWCQRIIEYAHTLHNNHESLSN